MSVFAIGNASLWIASTAHLSDRQYRIFTAVCVLCTDIYHFTEADLAAWCNCTLAEVKTGLSELIEMGLVTKRGTSINPELDYRAARLLENGAHV